MDCEVRRIRPGEGGRFREIRLHALSDAPSAFGSTFAAESVRPQAWWDEVAAARSAGDEAATFVAEAAGHWVGLVGGFRAEEQAATVELVSMWVAPEARRTGVARRLVDAVITWSRAIGAQRVQLWVTRGNGPAASLYRQADFVPAEERQPHPFDPCREEERMVLVLDRARSG